MADNILVDAEGYFIDHRGDRSSRIEPVGTESIEYDNLDQYLEFVNQLRAEVKKGEKGQAPIKN
jgi:hypothetical protein